MDSEEFQQKIDEQIRNQRDEGGKAEGETSDPKGKLTEKAPEETTQMTTSKRQTRGATKQTSSGQSGGDASNTGKAKTLKIKIPKPPPAPQGNALSEQNPSQTEMGPPGGSQLQPPTGSQISQQLDNRQGTGDENQTPKNANGHRGGNENHPAGDADGDLDRIQERHRNPDHERERQGHQTGDAARREVQQNHAHHGRVVRGIVLQDLDTDSEEGDQDLARREPAVEPPAPVDTIGTRNSRIERRAERITSQRGDDAFLDNPYAFTGKKKNIDPINGSNWEGRKGTWDEPTKVDVKEDRKDARGSQSARSTLWATNNYESHLAETGITTTPNTYNNNPSTSTSNGQNSGGQPFQGGRNQNRRPQANFNRGGRGRWRGANDNGSNGGYGNPPGASYPNAIASGSRWQNQAPRAGGEKTSSAAGGNVAEK
ncbi:uncharacterized protein MELLADRAFT_65432 [Melampsora larici-populina 98AG31]|uniref:Uncharacterized protein n=1 Tax=Melampsora larici-populina (strain 98AG31 / pathotype 3-4-7) TaxID=747676 RepID=F4RVB4_MELLP|nr:uncharacterized protein MELLADRAFT_65432 [Melampsora larici-populina 98AG31]EGG03699.1 hypothetical protein MELLADRAFT_65432 [Melampsora larici-populina 98AG31]